MHLAAVCGDSCKLAVLSRRGEKVADVLSSCNTEMIDPNVMARQNTLHDVYMRHARGGMVSLGALHCSGWLGSCNLSTLPRPVQPRSNRCCVASTHVLSDIAGHFAGLNSYTSQCSHLLGSCTAFRRTPHRHLDKQSNLHVA